jgi:hypothetical protein
MKILMLGDCAHVGYELARELWKRGHQVKHITFNHFSRFRYLKALSVPWQLAFNDCDLVHAHYARFPLYAAMLSGKPFVVQCHGSDVRYGVSSWQHYCLGKAKTVLVSTPDLLEKLPDATLLPTPIPSEFRDSGAPKHGAVYFKHNQDPELPIFPHFKGVIEVRERDVPYLDMPKILNQYKYVVDYHFPCLSKLALEALGCGCHVVKWQGEIVSNLPSKHRVENVVDKLEQIYREALS